MKINRHTLIHANDAGNGYHGWCAHCEVALVTDLGYCSWDNQKCIDRDIESVNDMPEDAQSYINFNSMKYDTHKKVFTKAYSEDEYTADEIIKKVKKLRNN